MERLLLIALRWRYALILALVLPAKSLFAQTVYTIKGDSVKIIGTGCDSGELIIQNHTQNVPGFLYNTGNGRTIFKRGAQQLGSGFYVIGGDTVKAWVQGGNSFGATGILGTLDNNHLDLYTNDTARARLTKTGNLLIGSTTDNGNKLQINGNTAAGGTVFLNAPVDTSGVNFFLNMSNQDEIAGIGHNMAFQVPTTAYNYYFSFGTDVAAISKSLTINGGNSGNINLTTVGTYFDINGVQHLNVDASPMYIQSGGASGNDGLVIERNARSTMMTDPLLTVLENTDTVVMRVLKNGNVGIGTGSPAAQFHTTGSVRFAGLTEDSTQTRVLVSDGSGNLYYRSASSLAAGNMLQSSLAAAEPVWPSLAVNGPIRAKKLTLSADNWPDYVFDSTYRLAGLNDVEAFIQKEHHLPGIPPAAEIAKDSLDVGAGQAALLKKIEELTLYTIKQEKEISALKAELEEIKALLKNR